MCLRRPFAAVCLAAASFAALACKDTASPASTLPLKNLQDLAAQLDTIHAGLSTPQLKSFSAMALPMLAAGFDIHHFDSTFLGKTVEWNSLARSVFLTTRPGTSSQALRVTLYALDNTGLPSPGKTEIGYAYLQFLNEHTGGRADSTYLRVTLFDDRQPSGAVVADWMVWRLPADVACGQCATISAGINPIAPGGRFISLTIPYKIPVGGDGAFAGTSSGAGFGFVHSATLPGPMSTAATAGWAFSWQGDSIRTNSGPLHPSAGVLAGATDVLINGVQVATVSRTATGAAARNGTVTITNPTDRRVLERLFEIPADIADNIEWPTFVIFFCGC